MATAPATFLNLSEVSRAENSQRKAVLMDSRSIDKEIEVGSLEVVRCCSPYPGLQQAGYGIWQQQGILTAPRVTNDVGLI